LKLICRRPLSLRITSNNNHCLHSLLPPPKKKDTKAPNSLRSRGQLPQIESNLFKNSFLADLFVHICRLVFLSWLQFVQCLCILFLFYLTVLFACMICFYYNVCDCHAFIKGNLLTYLLRIIQPVNVQCMTICKVRLAEASKFLTGLRRGD